MKVTRDWPVCSVCTWPPSPPGWGWQDTPARDSDPHHEAPADPGRGRGLQHGHGEEDTGGHYDDTWPAHPVTSGLRDHEGEGPGPLVTWLLPPQAAILLRSRWHYAEVNLYDLPEQRWQKVVWDLSLSGWRSLSSWHKLTVYSSLDVHKQKLKVIVTDTRDTKFIPSSQASDERLGWRNNQILKYYFIFFEQVPD